MLPSSGKKAKPKLFRGPEFSSESFSQVPVFVLLAEKKMLGSLNIGKTSWNIPWVPLAYLFCVVKEIVGQGWTLGGVAVGWLGLVLMFIHVGEDILWRMKGLGIKAGIRLWVPQGAS